MSQQLATIQIIKNIAPITDKDGVEAHSINAAQVLGWNTVAKKGSFKDGDLCVFIEIGAVVPSEKEPFVFMAKNKGRVRSARFLGYLSQGLPLPLSDFVAYSLPEDLKEGDDVTEALGIVKYEPPEERQSGGPGAQRRSTFPTDIISKTDEIRIQSKNSIIEEFKTLDCDTVVTLKMDGSSATYLMKDGEFHACSRNQSTKDTEDSRFWQIAHRYLLTEKLPALNNIAIQGELCGPTIQKNRLALKEYEFFMFNAYDTSTRKYLNYDDMVNVANTLGLKLAPLLYRGPFKWNNIDEVLAFANRSYEPFNPNHPAEGIVLRPAEERYSPALRDRMSIKAINNEFLLKIGE